MLLTFPPPITNLMDVVIATLRDVKDYDLFRESLKNAKAFNKGFRDYFDALNSSWIDHPEVRMLLEEISLFSNQRAKSFDQMELFLENGEKDDLYQAMTDFQQTSIELRAIGEEIMEKLLSIKKLSPFREIDDFARTARNVYSGVITNDRLEEKIKLLTYFRDSLKSEIGFFLYIFPDKLGMVENVNKNLTKIDLTILNFEKALKEGNIKEVISKELDPLIQSSSEIMQDMTKVAEFRRDSSLSNLPVLDNFIYLSNKYIDGHADLLELDSILNPIIESFLLSMGEFYEFHTTDLVRTEVGQKYYPFLEKTGTNFERKNILSN